MFQEEKANFSIDKWGAQYGFLMDFCICFELLSFCCFGIFLVFRTKSPKTSTPIGQKFKVELLPIGVQLHEISWIFGICSFFRFLVEESVEFFQFFNVGHHLLPDDVKENLC